MPCCVQIANVPLFVSGADEAAFPLPPPYMPPLPQYGERFETNAAGVLELRVHRS